MQAGGGGLTEANGWHLLASVELEHLIGHLRISLKGYLSTCKETNEGNGKHDEKTKCLCRIQGTTNDVAFEVPQLTGGIHLTEKG